jgi:hypothetical protein
LTIGNSGNRAKIKLCRYKREDKMLDALEFQAKIKNGFIPIPDEYKQELNEGEDIQVIILLKKKSSSEKDIIDELTENPVPVNTVLSREEIYSL